MNISTIDVSERDIEIRVRHDLDGPLGSITVSKCGVMIGGKHHPWEKLAPRAPGAPGAPETIPEAWDSEGLVRSLTAVSRD